MSKEEINRKIDAPRAPAQQGRDWTGDEAANAELLDEMASALELDIHYEQGLWFSTLYWPKYLEGSDPWTETLGHADRKTAIALAWIKFKESQRDNPKP